MTVQLAGAVEYTDYISAEGVRLHTHCECLGYDSKQSDDEAPVMLELWGMWSSLSLSLFLGPLWPGAVVPDRVKFIFKLSANKWLMLKLIVWNRTVWSFNCAFNWIFSDTQQYLEPFNYVQMKKMLNRIIMLNSNTCNHFTVCKQIINIE